MHIKILIQVQKGSFKINDRCVGERIGKGKRFPGKWGVQAGSKIYRLVPLLNFDLILYSWFT